MSATRATQTARAVSRTLPDTTGDVLYVSSTQGYRANLAANGASPDKPVSTLAYAATRCGANDTIILLEGHAETITAAAAIAIVDAGVHIKGLGWGRLKPTITLSTATTADFDIDAANVTIQNVRFVSDIDDLANILDVNADGCELIDCEFVSSSTKEFINAIDLATTKDYLTVRGCLFEQPTDPAGTDGAAATGAIYCVDSEHITVENCTFNGYFETACLHNKTTAPKYLTWRNNVVNQQLSTGRRIVLVAGTVGANIGPDSDFIPGLGYRVTKLEDVNVATTDALFDLTGKVQLSWTFEVTNALGAGVTDYQITLTTLNGVLLAAGNIASAAIGFMRNLNGDAGDTALSVSTGAVSVTGVADTNGKFGQLVVGRAGLVADVIKSVRTAGDASDAILHTVFYIPLEPGANLIASA